MGIFFPLNDFKQWLIAPLMIDWSIPTRVYYKFVLPGDIIHRSSMVPRQSANTLPRQILNRRPEKTYTLLSIFLLPHWFMIKLMLTHPVHFQLDTLSRSSQCGHRCTKPASDHLHQNTNSTLWTCVPVRWPGTPSHHPLLCKGKCCCHSWLRPGAVQSQVSAGSRGVTTGDGKKNIHVDRSEWDLPPWSGARQRAWHLACESSQL